MKQILRNTPSKYITLFEQGNVKTVLVTQLFQNTGIREVIRIRPEEYRSVPRTPDYLTHFNLQYSGHKKGGLYALPLIVKPGYRTATQEVLPILRFENCLVGRCIAARNHVPYSQLRKSDFVHSFPSIKTVAQLKNAILRRYSQSLPELSSSEILSAGVAITELKILGRWEDFKQKKK